MVVLAPITSTEIGAELAVATRVQRISNMFIISSTHEEVLSNEHTTHYMYYTKNSRVDGLKMSNFALYSLQDVMAVLRSRGDGGHGGVLVF